MQGDHDVWVLIGRWRRNSSPHVGSRHNREAAEKNDNGSYNTPATLPNLPQTKPSHSQSRAPNKVATLDALVPLVHTAASAYPQCFSDLRSLPPSHLPAPVSTTLGRTRGIARRTNTHTDKTTAEQLMFDRRAHILSATRLTEPTDLEAANSTIGIVMEPVRCTYPDPDLHPGVPQCTLLTAFGHLCEKHLAQELGLRVGPSPGKGNGFFATRTFAIDAVVGVYTGDKVHRLPNTLFPAGEYMLQSTPTLFINAARTTTSVMRNANDGAYLNDDGTINTSLNNCVFFKVNSDGYTVNITATREIRANQEILLTYGNDYWTSPGPFHQLKYLPARAASDLTIPATAAMSSPRKSLKPPAHAPRSATRSSPVTSTLDPRQSTLMASFKCVPRKLALDEPSRHIDTITALTFDEHLASIADVTDLTTDSD